MPHTLNSQPAAAPALDIAGLESVYETLASAVDAVGRDKSELFLAKLALLCAQRIGDAQVMATLVANAQKDL
ncbi:DUF2783 domain-containing protein [Pantoea sp. 18069]|uniref:DUF2783 domain-containing protein n=1 Tax=Pantoea sp. 18069 TaxID=2681415 RepID=UPI00135BD375|nr:DUF2783 domain-containing protein [Pantoea sp. 18069]